MDVIAKACGSGMVEGSCLHVEDLERGFHMRQRLLKMGERVGGG